MSARRSALVLAVSLPFLLGGCSTSARSLEHKIDDLPGVISVHVVENDGDDLPLTPVPKMVTVRMDGQASQAEIAAVFEALDDDIDDGDLVSVTVRLDGEHATLATGQGVHATTEMVQDLVTARDDAGIARYRRNAYPVVPSVDVALSTVDFDRLVATVERYDDAGDIDAVTVRAGRFVVGRDRVNDDVTKVDSRMHFVQQIHDRFHLAGALVSDRVPLVLSVGAADQAALEHFVATDPTAQTLGRIVIGQGPPRQLLEADGG